MGGVSCISVIQVCWGKFGIFEICWDRKEKYLQLLFDPGLFSFCWLCINVTSYLTPLSPAFFLCSKYSTFWPHVGRYIHGFDYMYDLTSKAHYLKNNWIWKAELFPFFCNISPTWIIVCLLKSCQNLNAVYPCYIPLLFGAVLIFLSVIDLFLFLFSSFVK